MLNVIVEGWKYWAPESYPYVFRNDINRLSQNPFWLIKLKPVPELCEYLPSIQALRLPITNPIPHNFHWNWLWLCTATLFLLLHSVPLSASHFRILCNPNLKPQFLMSYHVLVRESLLSLFQPFQRGGCSGGVSWISGARRNLYKGLTLIGCMQSPRREHRLP